MYFLKNFIDINRNTRKINLKNCIPSTFHTFRGTLELRFGKGPPQEEAGHEKSTEGSRVTPEGKSHVPRAAQRGCK